jgi:hypothetical protein
MTYQRIATTTVGATASTITFSAIPATFTDLLVILSLRTSNGGNGDYSLNMSFNGSPDIYRRTIVSGAGQTPIKELVNGTTLSVATVAQSGNSAVFSNTNIRILDYTSNTVKAGFVEDGFHYFSNGLSNFSGLYINNSVPITSITFSDSAVTNFIQNSTATLYGILKGGSGATISTT